MELTNDEKKVIRIALERHLEEVKEREGDIGQDFQSLAGEIKYEDFVENIIKKIKAR